MYAIVEIAGQQFKVQKKQYLYIPQLNLSTGTSVTFSQVLFLSNNREITIGSPIISEAKVVGRVLEHVRGDKVIVFKKKRRKGYTKKQGHRQDYTKVLIEDISI